MGKDVRSTESPRLGVSVHHEVTKGLKVHEEEGSSATRSAIPILCGPSNPSCIRVEIEPRLAREAREDSRRPAKRLRADRLRRLDLHPACDDRAGFLGVLFGKKGEVAQQRLHQQVTAHHTASPLGPRAGGSGRNCLERTCGSHRSVGCPATISGYTGPPDGASG